MLPQRAAVAFVLAEVTVNGAVMECDPVVFMQVGAYLFGTEFAADKGVDVLNQTTFCLFKRFEQRFRRLVRAACEGSFARGFLEATSIRRARKRLRR